MAMKDQYFRHDYHASGDEKMEIMFDEMGLESIGLFWMLCERLASSGGKLPLRMITIFAEKWKTDKAKIEKVINEYGLFSVNGETFSSNRLMKDLKHRQGITDGTVEAGKKSGKVRLEKSKADLKDRIEKFRQSLVSYIGTGDGKYPKEMIRAFFDYWSQTNTKGTKMYWETKPVFELSKRLATWKRNDDNRNFKPEDGEIFVRNPEDNRPA